mmetsp:Transcript_1174/g.2829  ORF Transcript_1174/g.2829 Transcript_1174/m.2829 type:complete len:150 (-) Transcript_1174:1710-2159(-)
MGEICSKIDEDKDHRIKPKTYPSRDLSSRESSTLVSLPPTVRYQRVAFHKSASKKKFLRMRNTVLMAAIRKQHTAVLRFIADGFPVNFPLTETGWRLAHVAAQTGDDKLLKLLQDAKADFTLTESEESLTPYDVAVKYKKIEIARILAN